MQAKCRCIHYAMLCVPGNKILIKLQSLLLPRRFKYFLGSKIPSIVAIYLNDIVKRILLIRNLRNPESGHSRCGELLGLKKPMK